MLRATVIILSVIMVVAGVSCTIISHQATPAEVDQKALQYAIDADVADFNDYDAWYPNMAEAMRLVEDVEAAYDVYLLRIQQAADNNDLAYSIHTKTTTKNFKVAQQKEEALFGEKGLLSMGLSLLGVGGLTGTLGLMRKRPGDITKPEMEQALASATGKTSAELSSKEKQLVQIVKGIQGFVETYKKNPTSTITCDAVLQDLKIYADRAQDQDTRAAVAVVKKLS